MQISKLFWALRSLILKPFFGKYGLMSYMGKPCGLLGMRNFYLGKKVRIYPGVRLESHTNGKLFIGDNVSIGQNFHCITGENQSLIIGDNTTISANVFVSNIDHDYRELNKHILEQPIIAKNTVIGENCFIGYGAVLLPGSKLGNNCIVGANAVVKGEYSENTVIAGNPAKIIKYYDQNQKAWVKANNIGCR